MKTLSPADPAFLGGIPDGAPPPGGYETEAQAWIDAVELADGAALETDVANGVNDFVVGCKTDGIWSAIKACVLLGGARTRTGAMTPLVGSAPTSFSFVDADYDRRTGLVGNGSTKYLGANRANNADPQNSKHLAAWKTSNTTSNGGLIGTIATTTGASWLFDTKDAGLDTMRVNRASSTTGLTFPATGFVAASRGASGSFVRNYNGTSTTVNSASSTTPNSDDISVFRSAGAQYINGRIVFYSIGENIDLPLLYARVDALVAVFAAIP